MSELSAKGKTPAIRFKGFSGAWVENHLGQLCDTFEYGLNAAAKVYDGKNKYIRITDINEASREFDLSDVTSPATDLSLADNYKLKYGDVLFARTGASVGKTYIYKKEDGKVYFAGFLIRARVKKTISPYFVFQNTLTDSYNKFIQVTSQRSGQPGVNAQEYSHYVLCTPNKKEQTQIGNFFQQLDRLIAQHQQKHEKLRCVKKALLTKMFPKQGEATPAIRFKGFSEAWEEKALGDICSVITKGTTPLDKSGNGEINFIKVENIDPFSGQIISTSKIKKEEHENYLRRSQLSSGDILFSIAGTLGRIAIVDRNNLPANTNQALAIIRLKRENIGYVTTFLKGKAVDDYVKKNPTVGAQPNLSLEQVGNINIVLPDNKEQTKIGNLFQQLDTLISQQQSQLTKLNNIKQSMLAKMFV